MIAVTVVRGTLLSSNYARRARQPRAPSLRHLLRGSTFPPPARGRFARLKSCCTRERARKLAPLVGESGASGYRAPTRLSRRCTVIESVLAA